MTKYPFEITAAEAGANILAHVEAHTLRQCVWHEGRDIACLLGAIHSGVDATNKCPASVMPLWLAESTVTLFDLLPCSAIYPIAARYGRLVASGAMARADDAVRDRWLVRVVQFARDEAPKLEPLPECWPQVRNACDRVIAALRGNSD